MTVTATTRSGLFAGFRRHRSFEAAKPAPVEVHAPPEVPTAEPDQPTMELPVPPRLADREIPPLPQP
jgi:hypothetical protein